MYCPQCGVTISLEGNFCGKCGKDVAYLTTKSLGSSEAAEAEPAELSGQVTAEDMSPDSKNIAETDNGAATTATEPAKVRAKAEIKQAKPVHKEPAIVYFCNYCGTVVYPEDNYCYHCGKKTRKEYYHHHKKRRFGKGKKMALGIVGIVMFLTAAWFAYRFARAAH